MLNYNEEILDRFVRPLKLSPIAEAALDFLLAYNMREEEEEAESVCHLHVTLEREGINVDGILGEIARAYPLKYGYLIGMTDEQREQQRQSFAYGNAAMSNPEITRNDVAQAAMKLRAENRSPDYASLSPEEQWDEDKELGILDWDGK